MCRAGFFAQWQTVFDVFTDNGVPHESGSFVLGRALR
jgi:hypothetical protein